MKSLKCYGLLPLLPIILLVNGWAQASPAVQAPNNDNVPVFHAHSKIVIADVVVTDKSGKAVTGLKASDFHVTENGKPQEMSVFEERSAASAATAPAATPPLSLAPNQVSNVPVDAPKSSINLLLFDMLNTPATQQQWAQEQMLKALQKLPPGQQVALFVLNNGLQMVQGVSGDSDTLAKAAKAIVASPNTPITTAAQHQTDVYRIAYLARFNGEFTGGTSADPAYTPSIYQLQGRLLYSLARMENAAKIIVAERTLDALEVIGHSMAAYPVRKNLIWVTSDVPFLVQSTMDLTKYHSDGMTLQNLSQGLSDSGTNLGPKVARTMRLLADAQVAVYLVDVKGLPTVGLTAADLTDGVVDKSQMVRDARNQQVMSNWYARDTMNNLAEATGGRAFTGSNDLSWGIDKSMEDGAHYYTLAYVPTNKKSDGLYRDIHVTTNDSSLKLAYRRGYFATEERATTSDESAKLLLAAMPPGMPPATSVLMKAQVLPPDASRKATQINYAVEPNSVQFKETPDQAKQITLDFLAVAWDSEGRVAASVSDTLDATLKPDFNMASIKGGIPAQQELELKPGKYVLSLGVMDRNTRAMGTMWVAVTVPGISAK